MNKLFTVLMIFLQSLLAIGQGKECGNRAVYCFDLDVTGYNPHLKYQNWKSMDEQLAKEINKEKEVWNMLHFASPGYKSKYANSDGGSERVYYYKNQTIDEPWFYKDCYGSPSQNYSLLLGDRIITATYSQSPPRADITDYIIYGTIMNSKTDGFKIEIKGINFRKNETLFNRFFVFDTYSEAYNYGSLAVGNGSADFSGSILPAYETKKRDEDNENNPGTIAIEPKLKFDKSLFTIIANSAFDCSGEISLTLTDCDGTLLKNKEIKLEVQNGTISPETVKTDENGKAQTTYYATGGKRTDQITAKLKFNYPSGRENNIVSYASIEIVRPVEFLDGQIKIEISNSDYAPSQSEQSKTSNTIISGKITCRIMRDRIQKYIDEPETRRECSPRMHCPVVSGGSDFQARDPLDYSKFLINKRFPLNVNTIKNETGIRGVDGKEKLVATFTSNAAGTDSVEGLTLEIKAYVAGEGQLAPLIPQYVIWLNGGKYLDKMSSHPTGQGSMLQWDIYKEKLVPVQDPVTIGIPYSISEPEADMEIYKTYDPLLITNYKEFEKYMLNPVGTFIIEATGKHLIMDDSSTSECTVNVILELTPHIEQAP
jgi:hypothetical protein